MDQAIRDLLDAADDPIHEEEPPDLDFEALSERVARLEPKMSRIAGRTFALDDEVQDATYFCDLSFDRWIGDGWEMVFAIRFSNFGSLFTAWNPSLTERLPDALVAELVQAVSFAGFQYVPAEALDASYTGRNPAFEGATWWQRFFDYT